MLVFPSPLFSSLCFHFQLFVILFWARSLSTAESLVFLYYLFHEAFCSQITTFIFFFLFLMLFCIFIFSVLIFYLEITSQFLWSGTFKNDFWRQVDVCVPCSTCFQSSSIVCLWGPWADCSRFETSGKERSGRKIGVLAPGEMSWWD